MKMSLVTLCGDWNFSRPWVSSCVRSWERLLDPIAHKAVIGDGQIGPATQDFFREQGFTIHSGEHWERQVLDLLSPFPALVTLRQRDLTWRKILDFKLAATDSEFGLMIDTDVAVLRPCQFPAGFDFLTLREDSNGYRGLPSFAWNVSWCPAVNSGVLLIRPELIDLPALDSLAERYFLPCRKLWWTEQSAWGALAARIPRKGYFAGRDAAVVSGFSRKRPASDVRSDRHVVIASWQPRRNEIDTTEGYLNESLSGLSIVHFAGPIKERISIPQLLERYETDSPALLNVARMSNAGWVERSALGITLQLRSWLDK